MVFDVSELRLNPHYVIWYKNFVTLLATLIIPFALLAYWNYMTAKVINQKDVKL